MPKCKRRNEIEEISRKLRRLQQELNRVRRDSDSDSNGDSNEASREYLLIESTGDEPENPSDAGNMGNQIEDMTDKENNDANTSTAGAEQTTKNVATQEEIPTELDSSILDIIGTDPSAVEEFSKDIHKELASRLEHIATTGLTKEARKELSEKYLMPANCTKIGSPLMNAEIKAAVTDIVVKRDKGIQMRQKQLGAAIAGLAGIINKELESKEKDSERLKQLMDVCRILCDIQHAESVIRRNFAVF